MDLQSARRILLGAMEAEGDRERAEGQQRYFKNRMRFLGLRLGDARRIVDQHPEAWEGRDRNEVLDLAESLMADRVFEHQVAAVHLVQKVKEELVPGDLPRFQEWLENHVDNWAEADEVANHILDRFILQDRSVTDTTFSWTGSESIWLRRAAAVCLVVPMRRQDHLQDVLRVSRALLEDPEDLVQKGYGWALKECSKKHPEEVYTFIMENRDLMPRTPLRIALEKYSPERRRAAMAR
ncbi:MAG: DNA alkylation repair protein [Candidatus Methanomethylophilaceae archaeon]|jgi:3-methyladenine DNA glycosylase AlkD